VKLPTKNAPASVQNTPVRTAAPRATPGTSVAPAAVRRARCGLGRRTSAWIGIVINPRIRARVASAVRQPSRVSSHASSGMKMVLASAATSVTVRSARSRLRVGNQPTTAAKAGS